MTIRTRAPSERCSGHRPGAANCLGSHRLEIERFAQSHYEEAVAAITRHASQSPTIGLILGSGLSSLAEEIEKPTIIPYREIPHFPCPTVEGHSGRLLIGGLEGHCVMVMQGRAHFYEGYSMQRVTFPVRVMKLLGVETLLLTNAAGGLTPQFQVGDLMLITDHINLPGMVGLNPLVGPNDSAFGPRFPDMTRPYDPELGMIARRVAEEERLPLHEGIYAMLIGPSFETPAEVRLVRSFGADAVGMSTVPEVVVARHSGLRVLGISGITNIAISDPLSSQVVSHEHVLDAGAVLAPRIARLIRGVLRDLPGQPGN